MNDENLVIGQCPECREINRHAPNCIVPTMRAFNQAVLARSRQHVEGKKTIIPSAEELRGWPIPHPAIQGNNPLLPELEGACHELAVQAAKMIDDCAHIGNHTLLATAALLDEYALLQEPINNWKRYAYAELASMLKMIVFRRGGAR